MGVPNKQGVRKFLKVDKQGSVSTFCGGRGWGGWVRVDVGHASILYFPSGLLRCGEFEGNPHES